MSYYHDLITEKSFKELQVLRRQYDFVLIGGWAVYLYTHGLKSRDIDFICDYDVLQKLKSDFDLIKNDRLKKYEVHRGEFDVDIYTPFFSDLGIPAEELMKMVRHVQGFKVLAAEPLLVLKQKAWSDRRGSSKGEKDKIDIVALLKAEAVNLKTYGVLLQKYKLSSLKKDLAHLLKETREVPELGLSEHSFSKLRKKLNLK